MDEGPGEPDQNYLIRMEWAGPEKLFYNNSTAGKMKAS
jgi:hypothetical protein